MKSTTDMIKESIINSQVPANTARELSADILAALSIASGDGVLIRTGDGEVDVQPPDGGAILHQCWAMSDHSSSEWYPNEAAAMAALEVLAMQNNRSVQGMRVDLTSPGCLESFACVEVR